jgi:hypothetical protein
LLGPAAGRAAPGEQGLQSRSPHLAVGGGLSGKLAVNSLTKSASMARRFIYGAPDWALSFIHKSEKGEYLNEKHRFWYEETG